MMLVSKKSDTKNGPSKLRTTEIGKSIQEDCYDENLSLIPEKFDEGKMTFLESFWENPSIPFQLTLITKFYCYKKGKNCAGGLVTKTVGNTRFKNSLSG